jgi:hypothetical protein
MKTDGRRVMQALKNLLSNAFKFTEHGGVQLTIRPLTEGWSSDQQILNEAERVVAFSVKDTGIGIARDKQRIIFEAFQQADAAISRKYGGTGLGLTISRQLVEMLGGEIRLESEPGKGSTFTLYLPITYAAPLKPDTSEAWHDGAGGSGDARAGSATASPDGAQALGSGSIDAAARVAREVAEPETSAVIDDREAIAASDRVLLIVEDDHVFAQILLDLARARGFKGLVATRAETALRLVHSFAATTGPRRLERPGPAQTRPEDQPHTGARNLGRRKRASGARDGRGRLPAQARHQGGDRRGARAPEIFRRKARPQAASRGGQ